MAGVAGFHHPLVRAARLLHQKKHRQARRCFLVEGPTAIAAALQSPVTLERIFATDGSSGGAAIEPRAREAGVDVIVVDDRTLRSLAQTREPQGVVGVARLFHRDIGALATDLQAGMQPSVCVALHEVSDPGNAGTLVRSADAFGVSAVVFSAGAVDPYNEKLVRASMGSLFFVPLFMYERWSDLAAAAKAAQLELVAAEAGAADVRTVTFPERCLLVIGNERRGLAGVELSDIAQRVGIPQSARVGSLNAAVAGSILLYEMARATGSLARSGARTNAS